MYHLSTFKQHFKTQSLDTVLKAEVFSASLLTAYISTEQVLQQWLQVANHKLTAMLNHYFVLMYSVPCTGAPGGPPKRVFSRTLHCPFVGFPVSVL